MRPLRLAVKAFGPYADEQIFDFRQLGGRTFFLIHGPTGSGKTTVLDAICFALYGDTSGDERKGKQMRSDLADPECLTEVTLDFSLGTELYRVTRSPEQERPKARGSGMTKVSPKAALWRRTGLPDDDGDGQLLAEKWQDTGEAVEKLLGFRSDQFRQVVLLPQGQFRKLLTANSMERETILERLFQTDVYRRIAERLKEAAREMKEKAESVRQRKKAICDHAGVADADALRDVRDSTAERLKELRRLIEGLKKAESDALTRLNEGRDRAARFQEHKEATRAFEALERRREEILDLDARLTFARKASTLVDAEANVASAEAEAEAALGERASARERAVAARKKQEEAQRRLAEEEAREPEREATRRELDRLEQWVGKVDALRGALERLAAQEQEAEKARNRHDETKRTLEESRKELDRARADLATAERESARLEGLVSARMQTERALQQRRELDSARNKLNAAEERLAAARRAVMAAEEKHTNTRQALECLEAERIAGHSALLALDLKPGVPCPVCGSTEHPAPAAAEGEIPDDAVLRDSRARLKSLETERDSARREESDAERDVALLKAKIENLAQSLEEAATIETAELESRLRNCVEKETSAKSAVAATRSLTDRVPNLEEREAEAARALTSAEEKLRTSEAARVSAATDLRLRADEIPEGLREPGRLEQARRDGAARLDGMAKAIESARESSRVASETNAGATEALKAAESSADAARRRAESQRVGFDERLREAGFINPAGSIDTNRYVTAKSDIEHTPKLESTIRSYHADLESARDRVSRAAAVIVGIEPPDLSALETTHSQARAALDDAKCREATFAELQRQQDRWVADLANTEKEMQKLEAEYTVLGRLADAANGKNPVGVNLQRFVLGTRLDDVLIAASQRLHLMSKGRYWLQRSTERATKRSPGGLDLEVFDGYTGVPRAVETLSGGESFLASLSLALGLADVVQAYSGGIHLETMFVDEGFGSLDPESLDLAIRALLDLQKGGRLVGIISHVPELKERVDVRLEILPGRNGSRARFVVG